jgi:hypothetical protein
MSGGFLMRQRSSCCLPHGGCAASRPRRSELSASRRQAPHDGTTVESGEALAIRDGKIVAVGATFMIPHNRGQSG